MPIIKRSQQIARKDGKILSNEIGRDKTKRIKKMNIEILPKREGKERGREDVKKKRIKSSSKKRIMRWQKQ